MYEELLPRIQNIYNSCTEEEQECLRTILSELSETGTSPTYEAIWLSDYKEIPVDIETFICDSKYLGKTNRNGKSVYPFWMQELKNVFGAGNKFHEWILTGATRIGKTSTAITAVAYMLYRMMCLKDPQQYFGKKEISKFSVLFFNVTKDLAKGVAYREFNDTLKASPWFNEHGTFSKSEYNFYYIPEGGKVVIDYGSDASHGLGQQVFCVVGDTRVLTDNGFVPISELAGKCHNLGQLADDNSIHYEYSSVELTKYTQDTIRIELEDGSIIEGTSDHLVKLTDGSYKKLGDLTNSDDVLTFNI